jgi:SAM-dependent methyltransferase
MSNMAPSRLNLIERAVQIYKNQGLIHLLKSSPYGIRTLIKGNHSGPEEFYENRNKQSLRKGGYTDISANRIFLRSLLRNYVDEESSILEIGCNAGANLYCLQDTGYSKLNGIELNPNAIDLMEEEFPELYYNMNNIWIGRAQDMLGRLENNQFDTVYTMAVLQHIHNPEDLFSEIYRITGDILITIEAEKEVMKKRDVALSQFVFRDYNSIFTELGFTEIECMTEGSPDGDQKISKYEGNMKDLQDYTVRVFKK